ncbi:DUF2845 domain-containing protein [Pseudomonas turukhanskensis]|uniref:DUF2845 domain-containing protein n=1 Tax=Pseudomonas turukhanskensis TaxID=1806536 RepID=A0A9W6NHN9_9PSED|nr:hypothetical protein GCM10017655_41560 [Pseudomonas turukhanskensis]
MKASLFYALTLLGLTLCGNVFASATLRCGSNLVSMDDRTLEVENKCGTPISRSVVANKVVYGYYGERSEVPVEEWAYGPRNGMYYYLRFEGNRLVDIDSKRGG